jgi:galactose mutarotase-like enzyme
MSIPLRHDETIEISTDALSVAVTSRRGARVTSLVNRHDGRQWLRKAQGGGDDAALPYGSTFTESDHGGWDEMFPTVDPCVYPTKPFAGATVPDHGELWQIDWDVVDSSQTSLHQRVSSDRFKYTFDRRLSVSGNTLRCEYECRVMSDVALPLLWALHPQFDMRFGSRVLLDAEPTTIIDISSGNSAKEVPWLGDLVVARDVVQGHDLEVYVAPLNAVSAASIVDESGSTLTMTWDREFAPYLCIWLDRGRFTQGAVVALEPTNGFFDDLARAFEDKTIRFFEPRTTTSWWVEITVGKDLTCKSL